MNRYKFHRFVKFIIENLLDDYDNMKDITEDHREEYIHDEISCRLVYNKEIFDVFYSMGHYKASTLIDEYISETGYEDNGDFMTLVTRALHQAIYKLIEPKLNMLYPLYPRKTGDDQREYNHQVWTLINEFLED